MFLITNGQSLILPLRISAQAVLGIRLIYSELRMVVALNLYSLSIRAIGCNTDLQSFIFHLRFSCPTSSLRQRAGTAGCFHLACICIIK